MESCIIEDNGQVVEMTLPSTVFSSSGIINSLPQVPVSTYQLINNSISLPLSASLPTVPVASLQNTHSTQQVPVTVSNLVSSLQQPLAQANFLPQVSPLPSLSPPDGVVAGAGEPPAGVQPVWVPAQSAGPSRAWPHPAPTDKPRQPGAGRGERDQQPAPVLSGQPGTVQHQPGQLRAPPDQD